MKKWRRRSEPPNGSKVSERLLGPNARRLKFWHKCLQIVFSKTGLYILKDKLLCAIPSASHQEDLDRKKSFLSGDIEASDLINEESPDQMSFLIWGSQRRRRVSLAEVSTIQSSLRGEGWSTLSRSYRYNGPPEDEAGRYYSY